MCEGESVMYDGIRPWGQAERPFEGVGIARAKACGWHRCVGRLSDTKENHDEEKSGIGCDMSTQEQRS